MPLARPWFARTVVACPLLLLLTVTLLLVPRELPAQTATAPTLVASTNTKTPIAAAMQPFVDSGGIAGAVTLVARSGQIVALDVVGQSDLEAKTPMRADSLFCIASMTKPITATALMMLVDEGKLSLDDPVSKFIPEFADIKVLPPSKPGEPKPAPQPPKRPVTVFDCVTHTAGLVGSQQNEGSLAESAAKLGTRPLAFEPGTKWQYSPGITVCGRVVEVVSGMPYEKFLDERIFRPLGMTDSTFYPTDDQQRRMARLYEPSKDTKALKPATSWIYDLAPGHSPNPSAGLFSTARDLARFYQMVLDGGTYEGRRLLSAEAVRRMTTIQTGDLPAGFVPGCGWGLGWCVVREPQGITATVSPGTFGHGGAFGTQGAVDPRSKTVYVLLFQRVGLKNSDGSPMREAFMKSAAELLAAHN